MIRLWKYILPLLAAVIFTSCSSKNEVEVIPRAKLADIYMEMFMTDQWITSTPGMRIIADTSLVYEPILEKYGYDKLDYMHSVDFYMNDPERFARILRETTDKLDKKIKHLQKIQKQQEMEEEAARKFERFLMDYKFEDYFPYMADEAYVHYYDSLTFEPDSLLVYRLVPIETADTLYDRLEMIVRSDTLSIIDTIQVVDTVVKEVKVVEPVDTLPAKVVKKGNQQPLKIERPKVIMPVGKDSLKKDKNLNSNIIWQEKE